MKTKGRITHANVPGFRVALVPSLCGHFKGAKIAIFQNAVKKWQQKCLFWVRVRVRVMVRVRVRARVMVRVRVKVRVRVRVRVRAGPPLGPPRTEVELSGRTEVELCLRVGPQN